MAHPSPPLSCQQRRPSGEWAPGPVKPSYRHGGGVRQGGSIAPCEESGVKVSLTSLQSLRCPGGDGSRRARSGGCRRVEGKLGGSDP